MQSPAQSSRACNTALGSRNHITRQKHDKLEATQRAAVMMIRRLEVLCRKKRKKKKGGEGEKNITKAKSSLPKGCLISILTSKYLKSEEKLFSIIKEHRTTSNWWKRGKENVPGLPAVFFLPVTYWSGN